MREGHVAIYKPLSCLSLCEQGSHCRFLSRGLKHTGPYVGIGYRTGKYRYRVTSEKTLLRQEIVMADTRVRVEKVRIG